MCSAVLPRYDSAICFKDTMQLQRMVVELQRTFLFIFLPLLMSQMLAKNEHMKENAQKHSETANPVKKNPH